MDKTPSAVESGVCSPVKSNGYNDIVNSLLDDLSGPSVPALLQALETNRPLHLVVNTLKVTSSQLCRRLDEVGVTSEEVPWSEYLVVSPKPLDTTPLEAVCCYHAGNFFPQYETWSRLPLSEVADCLLSQRQQTALLRHLVTLVSADMQGRARQGGRGCAWLAGWTQKARKVATLAIHSGWTVEAQKVNPQHNYFRANRQTQQSGGGCSKLAEWIQKACKIVAPISRSGRTGAAQQVTIRRNHVVRLGAGGCHKPAERTCNPHAIFVAARHSGRVRGTQHNGRHHRYLGRSPRSTECRHKAHEAVTAGCSEGVREEQWSGKLTHSRGSLAPQTRQQHDHEEGRSSSIDDLRGCPRHLEGTSGVHHVRGCPRHLERTSGVHHVRGCPRHLERTSGVHHVRGCPRHLERTSGVHHVRGCPRHLERTSGVHHVRGCPMHLEGTSGVHHVRGCPRYLEGTSGVHHARGCPMHLEGTSGVHHARGCPRHLQGMSVVHHTRGCPRHFQGRSDVHKTRRCPKHLQTTGKTIECPRHVQGINGVQKTRGCPRHTQGTGSDHQTTRSLHHFKGTSGVHKTEKCPRRLQGTSGVKNTKRCSRHLQGRNCVCERKRCPWKLQRTSGVQKTRCHRPFRRSIGVSRCLRYSKQLPRPPWHYLVRKGKLNLDRHSGTRRQRRALQGCRSARKGLNSARRRKRRLTPQTQWSRSWGLPVEVMEVLSFIRDKYCAQNNSSTTVPNQSAIHNKPNKPACLHRKASPSPRSSSEEDVPSGRGWCDVLAWQKQKCYLSYLKAFPDPRIPAWRGPVIPPPTQSVPRPSSQCLYYDTQGLAGLLAMVQLSPDCGDAFLDLCAGSGHHSVLAGVMMRGRGLVVANSLSHRTLPSLHALLNRFSLTHTLVTQLHLLSLPKGVLGSFSHLLLNAPCSGVGGVRAEERVHWPGRGLGRVRECARLQRLLILAAVDCLRPGGEMVYLTSSLMVEENEAVVEHALRWRHVELLPLSLPCGAPGLVTYRGRRFHESIWRCVRVFPNKQVTGAFFTRLRKVRD